MYQYVKHKIVVFISIFNHVEYNMENNVYY
jgi:hypothetical protein